MSGIARHHSEWLSLIEVSGLFLTLPVLVRVFPQGLPKVDGKKLGRLRAAYEEWANAQDAKAPDAGALHATWVQLVLGELLEFDDQTLRSGDSLPSGLDVPLAEHHETLRPSIAIVEPSGRTKAGTPRLLVAVWPSNQDLESAVPAARWAASPLERMTQLCRSAGVRLGLVTNGERWTVVDAPVGQTAGYASWYAGLWLQEPITLAAFDALLGVRRFFAVADTDTIESLLDESVAFQQDVTDQLGYQVRRAVEVLVQALDRADLDRNRELLRDVPPARLYDAALTVMMRLVFLFCAEERGLLLLGDETYDANYAVSTLRALLREEADRVGVEVLERRQDAWARLLANFRAVHGGVDHEALRLPALGGSLFDPDRFPFLEGRAEGTSWLATPASPLPIDNRTVLHLLEALQLLRTRGDGGTSEARKLSYRALDIEQIGHVYEGLLDHVAVRVDTDTLGLLGTKGREPELSLDELNRERRHGRDGLIEFLKKHCGRSNSALRDDLDADLDEVAEQRLLVACGNDKALVRQIAPYHALIHKDAWGYPRFYRAGSFMVTGGPERRQTGTHYTPKSLTEQIVTETLEPLVYIGPAEGKARDAWKLRSPAELLDLKICDMAMGSGAFLVQICRWLAERVVEAWEESERQGAAVSADGEVLTNPGGRDLLPPDREARLSFARSLVAERCVYGVDINPMAVELAKLSIWLITLAKGRPFGFLDHNLRSGDSLLGIHRLDQLTGLSLDPSTSRQGRLFGKVIERAVREAVELRRRVRKIPIRDIHDVEAMTSLDAGARKKLEAAELLADAFIGVVHGAGTPKAIEMRLAAFAVKVDQFIQGDARAATAMRADAQRDLACGSTARRPFHWALDFADVFVGPDPGFDAVIGNPPWASYSGRQAVPLAEGDARYYGNAYRLFTGWKALHSLFIERATALTRTNAALGLLLPAQVADLDGYGAARALLRNRFNVAEPLPYFGESAFVGVIQPSCAVIAIGGPLPSKGGSPQSSFSLQPISSHQHFTVAKSAVAPTAQADTALLASVIAKMERHPLPPAAAFGDPGVHTGNCSKTIILSKPVGVCALVREGKNVFPHLIGAPSRWLRLDYEPSDGEYFTIRDLAAYVVWPILIRQTATRPIACLHADPTYFRNSVLACRGIAGVPHEIIVAWLNSSAIALFHLSKVREANQRVFPQVKVKHLRALPLPSFDATLINQIRGALGASESTPTASTLVAIDRLISRAFGLSESEHASVLEAVTALES